MKLLRKTSEFHKKKNKIVPVDLVKEGKEVCLYQERDFTVPETTSQLYQILHRITNSAYDENGRKRVNPSEDLWPGLMEELPSFDPQIMNPQKTELLLPPIFDSQATTVFNIRNHPDKVIRYHVHYHRNRIDPTVNDYWFLKVLEPLRIAPKAYYYSGPLVQTTWVSSKEESEQNPAGKTRKIIFNDKKKWFNEDKKIPEVRFAILEKVGINIYHFAEKQSVRSLSTAIRLGGQMIQLIETLHGRSLAHGDAHMGNFAFSNEGDRLLLIDFGQSKVITHTHGIPIDGGMIQRSRYGRCKNTGVLIVTMSTESCLGLRC
jgi:hypothetical protein